MQYHSHFGVYAIIPDAAGEKVLLVKKARGPYKGLYDLPGGSMEPHELLEETLYREVHEETGCMAQDPVQAGTFSVLYPYEKDGAPWTLRHIGVIYRARVAGTPQDTGDDDCAACLWVPIRDISAANATPFVVEAVRTL